LTHTACRYLAIAFVDLDADSFAAEVFRRSQRRTATHKRIKNYLVGVCNRFDPGQGYFWRERCRVSGSVAPVEFVDCENVGRLFGSVAALMSPAAAAASL
jgi:hypothetical protein|tara:strand:+ start:77 stop:376 length:300 start_codon:yes stop_codon:yes gene_type:complete